MLSDGGTSVLDIDLLANEQLSVVSAGTQYSFSLTGGTFTDGGVAAAGDFSAFGGGSISLLSAGLTRYELSNLLAFSGSRFAQATAADGPAGIVDVMPTLLHLLGLSDAARMDGRVLAELLASDASAPPAAARHRATAEGAAGYRQCLTTDEVAGVRYIYQGLREDAVGLESACAATASETGRA